MPFHDSHDLPEFREWLIKTLEPLCDADPLVMSDYIVALLQHDAVMSEADWKEFITKELSDFLENNARPFVENLFKTLHMKSFLPTTAPTTTVAPAPVPANPPAPVIPSGPAADRITASGQPLAPLSGPAPAPVSSYRPPTHVAAPVTAPTGPKADQPVAGPSRSSVTEQNAHEAGQQTGNGLGNGLARMEKPSVAAVGEGDVEMGGGQAVAGRRQKCFDYHEKGYCLRGAACPYEHSEDAIIPGPDAMFDAIPFPPPQPPGRAGPGGGPGPSRGRGRGRGGGMQNGNGHAHSGPTGFPGQQDLPFPQAGFFPFMPMSFPQFLANDPRQDFWGSSSPPQEKTSTLVITDIPVAQLSVPSVREYFAQFGEVTNVAVETRSKRALVTFSNNREAFMAWKSDDAIFGSRHVKVLWHRPRAGQGAAGQKALQASAGLVANLKKMDSVDGAQGVQGSHEAKLKGPDSRLRDTLAELEARERRGKRETLMAEQKVLLSRAMGMKAEEKEEKVKILARLREITKEVEALDKPVPYSPAKGADVEMSDKERLDAELEKHGMESVKGKEQEELLKLEAQLHALRDKASTLGIPSSTPSSTRFSPYPSARGSRGRGRARGRGRGGFASRPMSLDNRSRVISVSGDGLGTDAGKTAVREWYESLGGVVDAGDGRGMLVTYPNREMAERALAEGTKGIAGSGAVSATWHNSATGPGQGSGTAAADVEMREEGERRGDHDEEE